MSRKTAFAYAAMALVASATMLSAQGMTSDHLTAIDANKDGAVDRTEFDKFMTVTFTSLDKNGDGSLTVTETTAILPADAFAKADANGDGKLSRAEFTSVVAADFKKADLDGDGRLN